MYGSRLIEMAQVNKVAAVLLAAACVAACATSSTREATATALDTALAAEQRSAPERARDRSLHPKETLLFFGFRPNMRVLEIEPERGGYTDVLAPLLRREGKYYAAVGQPASGDIEASRQLAAFREKLAARPDLYDRVSVVPFPLQGGIAPGTLDMVVSLDNLHGWIGRDTAPYILAALYTALKPGGALGVVEQRSPAGSPPDPGGQSAPVNQEAAITLLESAGFRLVGESQVNASRASSAQATGDRFTLKLVKPRQPARP
jgi:predicted methyltransferase